MLEDYAFKEAFSGCGSLKRAPKIPTYEINYDHIFQDMYKGCNALEEIHWESGLGPSGSDWESWYPGAPRFGAPESAKVIYDMTTLYIDSKKVSTLYIDGKPVQLKVPQYLTI